MNPQRVTMISLAVSDLDRSKAFYAALGWIPEQEMTGIAFYALHGQRLGLAQAAIMAEEQGRDAGALGHGAMVLAQNHPTEAEVDAAYEAAIAAGATALKRPIQTEWGGYSGLYADPDGHVWEIAMNPFWPLDTDGLLPGG